MPCDPPLLAVSTPWPEPPAQFHHISCSYCSGIGTHPRRPPCPGDPAGRGNLPLVALCHTTNTRGQPGTGTEGGTNPSVRRRRAAGGGRQQAGTMDEEGGAMAAHSSSPPAWRLVQCVPHCQSTGEWDLCEQLGRGGRTSSSRRLPSSQTDRQRLVPAR